MKSNQENPKSSSRERTFVMVKPDGVQRSLVGQIIARFEIKGLKLGGLKFCMPDKEVVGKHYEDLNTKSFYKSLTDYIG